MVVFLHAYQVYYVLDSMPSGPPVHYCISYTVGTKADYTSCCDTTRTSSRYTTKTKNYNMIFERRWLTMDYNEKTTKFNNPRNLQRHKKSCYAGLLLMEIRLYCTYTVHTKPLFINWSTSFGISHQSGDDVSHYGSTPSSVHTCDLFVIDTIYRSN